MRRLKTYDITYQHNFCIVSTEVEAMSARKAVKKLMDRWHNTPTITVFRVTEKGEQDV